MRPAAEGAPRLDSPAHVSLGPHPTALPRPPRPPRRGRAPPQLADLHEPPAQRAVDARGHGALLQGAVRRLLCAFLLFGWLFGLVHQEVGGGNQGHGALLQGGAGGVCTRLLLLDWVVHQEGWCIRRLIGWCIRRLVRVIKDTALVCKARRAARAAGWTPAGVLSGCAVNPESVSVWRQGRPTPCRPSLAAPPCRTTGAVPVRHRLHAHLPPVPGAPAPPPEEQGAPGRRGPAGAPAGGAPPAAGNAPC